LQNLRGHFTAEDAEFAEKIFRKNCGLISLLPLGDLGALGGEMAVLPLQASCPNLPIARDP
jgi:hypothetical protein